MQAAVIPQIPAISLRRILYATDFSQASFGALPIAANLARLYGAKLYVSHVWSALPASMIDTGAAISIYDQLRMAAEADMATVLSSKTLQGLPSVAFITEGEPAQEIARQLEQQDIDLVVVGTHGRTGADHLVMGSVAENICRSATCPVLTVGPNVEQRFKEQDEVFSILFPTDMSKESLDVLPYVDSISQEFGSVVNILHVLPAATAANPKARTLAEPLRTRMKQVGHKYLHPGCDADYAIEFGDTAEIIVKVADQTQADLIALGIRHAFMPALHFQNTIAYKVMVGATCPVLVSRTNTKRRRMKTV